MELFDRVNSGNNNYVVKYISIGILSFLSCYLVYYALCYVILKTAGINAFYGVRRISILCSNAPKSETILHTQLRYIYYTQKGVQLALLLSGLMLLKRGKRRNGFSTWIGLLLVIAPVYHALIAVYRLLISLYGSKPATAPASNETGINAHLIVNLVLIIIPLIFGAWLYPKYFTKKNEKLFLFAITMPVFFLLVFLCFNFAIPLINSR